MKTSKSSKNGELPPELAAASTTFDDVFATSTAYKTRGSSFGNKLLISLPILNLLIPLVFMIAAYFYVHGRIGNAFLQKDQDTAFVSDIGDKTPQSSIFSFGVILGSFTSLCIVVVRYFQVKHFYVKHDGRINDAGLCIGVIFILGKVLVSSFQLSSQRDVHFVGAGVYVFFACIYAIIQTIISCKNGSLYAKFKNVIVYSRIFLTAGMIIGTLIFLIFLLPDLLKYNKKGYSVGQGGEWFFLCCKMVYMLTFVVDFWPLHPRLLLIKPNKQTLGDLVLTNKDIVGKDGRPVSASSSNSDKMHLETIREWLFDFRCAGNWASCVFRSRYLLVCKWWRFHSAV